MNQQKSLVALMISCFLFFIFVMISTSSLLSEYFVRTISRFYSVVISSFVNIIPFSITEMIWISLAIFMIMSLFNIIQAIKHKKLHHIRQPLIDMTLVITLVLNVFMLSVGIAYRREEVIIPLHESQVERLQFIPIIEHFKNDFNDLASTLSYGDEGSVINPYSIQTLSIKINDAFDVLDGPYFSQHTIRIKPMLFSFLYNEFHITGLHFGPSTEALVNRHIPPAVLPFTMAHELAHARGVMRENEANLVALYVLLQSEDPYLRYSAYFASFYALLNLARFTTNTEDYANMVRALHPSILADYAYQGQFWSQFTLLNDLAEWVNDLYLRILGNEGTISYTDIPITQPVEEDGEIREVIVRFSPFQRLYFHFYFMAYSV